MIEAGFLLALGVVAALGVLAVAACAFAVLWPVLLVGGIAVAAVFWWEQVAGLAAILGALGVIAATAWAIDYTGRRAWAAFKARRQGARIAP